MVGRTMTEDKETLPEPGGGAEGHPIRRQFATAKEQLQFSYDHSLMSWTRVAAGFKVLQIVVPNKEIAQSLVHLIESQHGDMDGELCLRQSPSQDWRWVVQMPLEDAAAHRLLPKGIMARNLERRVYYKRAPGDATAAYSSFPEPPPDVPEPHGWRAKIMQARAWLQRGQER